MKIQTITVVLITLVSALAFISLGTEASASCNCAANQTCLGGRCIPNAIVPPLDASIDTKTCKQSDDTVGCRITMPKKSFEKQISDH